jgi:hypothetical protein
MKNRPDKPGCYWWEDDCGRYHAAEFDEEMETLDSCDTGFVSLEKFENSACFIRWVGPARPPKKVDRYNYEAEYGCFGATQNNEMVIRQNGTWIRYKDVKEFLLKGDENG